MDTARPFRFGINLHGTDADGIVQHARKAEEAGFDALHAADHLGSYAPFTALAAAAAVTSRIALGTLVLNSEFWNPALLAREAVTVDRISGGRLELGLGCGYKKAEFEDAGIRWHSHGERLARMESTIAELDRRFAEAEPAPWQTPRPPVLIGAHGKRGLKAAARHADIIGFNGLTQVRGATMGTFQVADPEETLQRVEFVAEQAGERAAGMEFNALIQRVLITDDAEKTAAELAEQRTGGLDTARKVLDCPFVLIGTAEEIAEEIIAARERYGFSYLVTHGLFADALAEVMPLVRRRTSEEGPTTPAS
jgi:probable F420-dependent oxidoreductase